MYRVSVAYAAIYHLLILALPFSFWGWWQAKHPGDLQNASVPVTVVLAMVPLFFGTNGILTIGWHGLDRGELSEVDNAGVVEAAPVCVVGRLYTI